MDFNICAVDYLGQQTPYMLTIHDHTSLDYCCRPWQLKQCRLNNLTPQRCWSMKNARSSADSTRGSSWTHSVCRLRHPAGERRAAWPDLQHLACLSPEDRRAKTLHSRFVFRLAARMLVSVGSLTTPGLALLRKGRTADTEGSYTPGHLRGLLM
jgi:hypothetical protein